MGLLVYFVLMVSKLGQTLFQEKSRIYGTKEMDILHIGLLMPKPRNALSPEDVEYRDIYQRCFLRILLKSVVLWTCIAILS
ncbi:MAG: hypothetical protein ACJAXK_002899 [Yoonia sp.]|jgi:hypothetical protein